MHTSLKFPSQKPNTQGSTCLTYQTGSPGGAPGGRGGHRPPNFWVQYTVHGAVGNRCGHKKNIWACRPPPPPAALAYTKPDRQHMPTKPNVSDRQHMLTKPNISDRLKMTNTSQKPNIPGKLTMRTDLKCQHITRE